MKIKNAGLAAVFSFFIPGLGQIYNGEFQKAIWFILGTLLSIILTPIFIGTVLYVIVWVWAIYDAYESAERITEGRFQRVSRRSSASSDS